MEKVLDKFLRYIAIDTTSDPDSETQPSTQKQFNLLRLLRDELEALALEDVVLDQYGYLTALLPATHAPGCMSVPQPVIGLIAHVDTAPDAPGASIKPQIVPQYDGQDILLNAEKGLSLCVADFPELTLYKGQTLVTTDGTTLLGADDKAGVAEIMCAIETLVHNPQIPHGPIKIAFTPDEEIGRGVDKFDEAHFAADFAYTVDGGQLGELEFENFNAAMANLHFQGRNVHPGYAKDKMRNALLMANEFINLLPVAQRPEYTQQYEGFYHITQIKGTVEEADVQYIIRDHSTEKFTAKKAFMEQCVAFINAKYGPGSVAIKLQDQYYNMRHQVEPHYHIIERALKAMEKAGVTPIVHPIRGGTDGAQLSFRGLPCPNLFAGGHNFHGKYEFVPVESMEKAVEVLLNIVTQPQS